MHLARWDLIWRALAGRSRRNSTFRLSPVFPSPSRRFGTFSCSKWLIWAKEGSPKWALWSAWCQWRRRRWVSYPNPSNRKRPFRSRPPIRRPSGPSLKWGRWCCAFRGRPSESATCHCHYRQTSCAQGQSRSPPRLWATRACPSRSSALGSSPSSKSEFAALIQGQNCAKSEFSTNFYIEKRSLPKFVSSKHKNQSFFDHKNFSKKLIFEEYFVCQKFIFVLRTGEFERFKV